MIDQSIQGLKQLRESLNSDSCVPKGAFITLGDNPEKAPKLNYNLPQSTRFQSYGHLRIDLKDAHSTFKEKAFEIPRNNVFDTVANLDKAAAAKKLLKSNRLSHQIVATAQSTTLLSADDASMDAGSDSKSLQPPPTQDETTTQNHLALPHQGFSQAAANQIADFIEDGKVPVVLDKFGGFSKEIATVQRPERTNPSIYVMEEYTTASFLGDYGAGKVLNTFSLLPGEKTTISIKTYKESNTTRSRAENLLDSFSENSTNEMEKWMQDETDVQDANKTETKFDTKVSLEAKVKLWSVGNLTAKAEACYSKNSTASRTANAKSLSKAMDKHVAQSNSNRQVNVNTSSSESVKEGEEQSTVRELLNLNKSRTLNFVFRQMMQEYVCLTYLSNIQIVFTNGYPESTKVVSLEDLDSLLDTYVHDTQWVKRQILKHYCKVLNYLDEPKDFLEEMSVKLGECVDESFEDRFYRICKGLEDSYTSGGLRITIPRGVILTAQSYILETAGVVADAFLGQGEALDCFNMKMQDAESIRRNLDNMEVLQRIQLIEDLGDPNRKAELYKRVYGTCCDTPQTQVVK
jgi:hypothetical protein